jgi:hypothetical protein
MKNMYKVFIAFCLMIVAISARSQSFDPGTRESLGQRREALNADVSSSALAAVVGLQQFYSVTGNYTLSADGKGSLSSSMTIRVNKPNAQATVEKAILISTATNGTIANGCVTIAGSPISWEGSATSSGTVNFSNYWADITSTVKDQINGFPAGISTLNITECNTSIIEGEALLVIFKDPSATQKTIIVMLGAQNPAGDNFSVTLAKAIDPTATGALLDMGLGIGFGFQASGGNQRSQVSVNGQRITSSSGGEDDGASSNGALITVGGIGDLNTNPADPLAGPVNPRTDDELYSILPFITNTTTSLNINTINPSLDDNIFLAYFAISGTAIIGEGILLSQTTASGNIGTEHSVKASVLNTLGQPVPNRQVTFTVTSGPNAGKTFSTNTNASGEATFTYTGSGGAGTDNIRACFTNSQGVESCSTPLTFEWTQTIVGFYYSKSTGDLHNVTTWGVNPDGSGANPPDFGEGKTFNLANRTNMYIMTGNWTVGGVINIPSGAQLSIGQYTLSEAGILGQGTLTGSQVSNLIVIGNGAHIINFTPGNSSYRSLNNFTLNRTFAGDVVALGMGDPLNVFGVLTVNSGTLLTNNALTLKSTAANTARVAPVPASGNITGNVTVERYIPARRAWRILSSSVGGAPNAARASVSLSNSQENPPVVPTTSGGTPRPASFGTATFTLNPEQTSLRFTATINNIDFTGMQTPDPNDNLVAAHIHAGPAVTPTTNGPVVWGFFGAPLNDNNPNDVVVTPFATGVGGTVSGKWDAPEGNNTTLAAQLPNLFAGRAYINFHTTQFGGGEIRGNITLTMETSQTINQAWQEGVTTSSPNPNPNPGYGTHITQGNANGFDFNPVDAMFSIKRYVSASDTWVPLSNTNATNVSSDAYMLFVRGDRSIPLSYNTVAPTNTTLRANGPLRIGDQTFTVNPTGFTAIPNPFASPINFATITRNNVQNNFYLWDPKLGGANGVGGYVLVSFNGSSYDVTPSPVSPLNDIIQSGQGFLVRSTGVTGSIVIKESDKSATAATNAFRSNASTVTPAALRVSLQTTNADNTTDVVDETMLSYGNNFSNKIDNYDAAKLANINENIAIWRDNATLAVERRAGIETRDTIQLKIWNTISKNYVLEFKPENLPLTIKSAVLVDNFLRTSTPVSVSDVSRIPFTITADAASANTGRFMVVLSTIAAPADIFNITSKKAISIFPNPMSGKTINVQFTGQPEGTYAVELVNSVGQVVYKGRIVHAGGTATKMLQLNSKVAGGLYQLRVTQKNATTTLKVVASN